MEATDRSPTVRTDDGEVAEPILRVEDLEKEYDAAEGTVTAVDGVSFSVGRGEVVGLLGPNGAGKTTTMECCLGSVTPSSGTIRVDGADPTSNLQSVHRSVAAVLEGARNVYWRLTVRENLRFFTGIGGTHPDEVSERHDRLLSALELNEKADEVVRSLSRGQQQKVSLACVLARGTPLVFLDEPTLGLDVEASRRLREEIRRLVEEQDRAVVLSSHDMDVVREVCDRVVVMNEGRIVADDAVESLVDLFRTQAYRVRFQESGSAKAALRSFDAEWDDDAVEVTLSDPERLYDLMTALAEAGAVVESMASVEPDFEDVFVSLTAGSPGERTNGDGTGEEYRATGGVQA
jgi:ABC-2 type transport system ATP-binding protein